MKESFCKICGNVIENGYDVNPQNSEVCEQCLSEEFDK